MRKIIDVSLYESGKIEIQNIDEDMNTTVVYHVVSSKYGKGMAKYSYEDKKQASIRTLAKEMINEKEREIKQLTEEKNELQLKLEKYLK